MGRAPRQFVAGATYHVWSRGSNRQPIFLHDRDRDDFLGCLGRVVSGSKLCCLAYCLMPNHYHLVVEAARDTLSRALHRVNGLYAQGFNEKHGRSGHLWGDRFALWQVRDDEHLREACLYVVRNPVRARLCEAPVDWPWSWSRFGRSAEEQRGLSPRAARRA